MQREIIRYLYYVDFNKFSIHVYNIYVTHMINLFRCICASTAVRRLGEETWRETSCRDARPFFDVKYFSRPVARNKRVRNFVAREAKFARDTQDYRPTFLLRPLFVGHYSLDEFA